MTTHSAFAFDLAAPAPLTHGERFGARRPNRVEGPSLRNLPVRLPPMPAITAAPVRKKTTRRSVVGRCLLNLPRVVWMMLDVLLVCGGALLGDQLFVWWSDTADLFLDYNLWLATIVLGSAVVLAGSIFGLYEPSTLWARSRIVVRCLLTVTLAMLATWLVMHLFMYSHLSRRAAACGTFVYLAAASSIRLACHHAILEVRRGLLVIGTGPLTGAIIRSVRRGSVPGYGLVGVVLSDRTSELDCLGDIPVVGDIRDIETLCNRHDVAEIVVGETAMRDPKFQKAALACLRLGCRVTDETTFYESTYGEVPVTHITPHWFFIADLKAHRKEHAVLKRVMDGVVACAALTVGWPLFLIAGLLVKLEDGGPIFYTQKRVGQGGRCFTLFKFRTMRADAEARGSTWAAMNDPRTTRVGRILRKLRFDELPQLWNIIRGDMSLVGPRPERPEFAGPLSALIPFYEERHLIKPGLTGWAQINYRYGSTIADARQKLQLDLYYIKHASLELDLVILLRTLGTFFLGSR